MADYGLLGRKLGHSYSPQIHSMLGGYEYDLCEKEPDELEYFLKNGTFHGLNVTIPYKKAVIPYCAELSETAREIGSVNTLVHRPDDSLYGDNTDAFGFERLVLKNDMDVSGAKTLVLGSGGASVTVCAVLKKLGAREVTVVSRSGENNYVNLSQHFDTDFIVNATPMGMYPNNGESLLDLRLFPNCRGVLDVIYNPAKTALLMQAEELGIPSAGGLYMLVAQAKRSSELFTGREIPDSEIDRIANALAAQMRNIVLIGMPGCGKSSVAAALSEKTGREVLEADTEIAARAGMSIPEIFAKYGEAYFRALETAVLSGFGKRSGVIISTGGGCVTRTENYPLLHQNGVVVWLHRDLDKLARDGRPLSLGGDLKEMYEKRRDQYEQFSDILIDNNACIDDTVCAIIKSL